MYTNNLDPRPNKNVIEFLQYCICVQYADIACLQNILKSADKKLLLWNENKSLRKAL